MFGTIPISAGNLGLILLFSLLAPQIGWFLTVLSLAVNLQAYAKYHPSTAEGVPDLAGGRFGWIVFAFWVWTDQHRKLADKSITRTVNLSRILGIVSVVCIVTMAVAFRTISALLAQ
jgi:hypothetical protein